MKALGITINTKGIFPVSQYNDAGVQQWFGYVYIGNIGAHDAWIVSGTKAQLQAISARADTIGICIVTEKTTVDDKDAQGNVIGSHDVHWLELDNTLTAAQRTKINNWVTNTMNPWLTARGRDTWPTITAAMTAKQIVKFLFNKLNNKFDLDLMTHDICDNE